jgi:hypothetical protein
MVLDYIYIYIKKLQKVTWDSSINQFRNKIKKLDRQTNLHRHLAHNADGSQVVPPRL